MSWLRRYLFNKNNNQMSFPVGAVSSAITATNPLDVLMASVNSNPYFIGLMMLLLNLGGRFLALEITKGQEKFLSQPLIRRFFLFAVLFVATRNVIIAAGLAVIVILLLGYLFNENSELCLWNSCITPIGSASSDSSASSSSASTKNEGFVGLSAEEAMILKRLQDKNNAAVAATAEGQGEGQGEGQEQKAQEKSLATSLYTAALTQITSFRE
jgi:hypothetical protein